jgi:hypothetical protein
VATDQVGDRLDLLLGHTEVPQGLAVLGEDELAPRRPSGADLAQFPQNRIQPSLRALVQPETGHRVLEDVGDESEHGPPVARRAPVHVPGWATGSRPSKRKSYIVVTMGAFASALGT